MIILIHMINITLTYLTNLNISDFAILLFSSTEALPSYSETNHENFIYFHHRMAVFVNQHQKNGGGGE